MPSTTDLTGSRVGVSLAEASTTVVNIVVCTRISPRAVDSISTRRATSTDTSIPAMLTRVHGTAPWAAGIPSTPAPLAIATPSTTATQTPATRTNHALLTYRPRSYFAILGPRRGRVRRIDGGCLASMS